MADTDDWNAKIIDEFKSNEGRVGGQFEGAPMTLVHHQGRKSGRQYVSPMMYLASTDDESVIYVFASKAGAPENPDWYHNLTAGGPASIEVGTTSYPVNVTELSGPERDRVFDSRPAGILASPSTPRRQRVSGRFRCSACVAASGGALREPLPRRRQRAADARLGERGADVQRVGRPVRPGPGTVTRVMGRAPPRPQSRLGASADGAAAAARRGRRHLAVALLDWGSRRRC